MLHSSFVSYFVLVVADSGPDWAARDVWTTLLVAAKPGRDAGVAAGGWVGRDAEAEAVGAEMERGAVGSRPARVVSAGVCE